MRMRKKRNLEPRIEACSSILLARGRPCLNLKQAEETVREIVDYKTVFGNSNPVELEVGCGNGGFVREIARRNPNVNYLAVEICTNVVLTALESVLADSIPNIRFLNIPAEILPCYLPEKSVRAIYLNFSTPLPESTREKQRLTSARFLRIYKRLLTDGGKIIQKTDSEAFFDYSVQSLESEGFCVTEITRDLHASEWARENIITEYEKNFLEKGMPIYRLCAILPRRDEASR